MKKYKVLIVEDESIIRKNLADIVHDVPYYEAIESGNGMDALNKIYLHQRWFGFKSNDIKCILLDIKMPGMNGLTFLKYLRLMETMNLFMPMIPVVFISAYDELENWNAVLHNRVVEYIKKPISPAKLVDTLDRIIIHYETEAMSFFTKEKAIKMKNMHELKLSDYGF